MTPAQREAVRQRAGGRCEYCRLPDSADFHVEHIIGHKSSVSLVKKHGKQIKSGSSMPHADYKLEICKESDKFPVRGLLYTPNLLSARSSVRIERWSPEPKVRGSNPLGRMLKATAKWPFSLWVPTLHHVNAPRWWARKNQLVGKNLKTVPANSIEMVRVSLTLCS